MAGRGTNLGLLLATVLAIVSGAAAFVVGTAAGTWVIVAHGVIALVIVVLTPWKSVIARRGLLRKRPGRPWSLLVTAAVLVTLASGGGLVSGEIDAIGPFTLMQVHVGGGLLAVSLTLVHTLQRPVPFRQADLGRRSLLRAGGLLSIAGGLWLATEGALDLLGARGGRRRFTGSHQISDPRAVPPTQWLNDSVQHLDRESHVVVVDGRRLAPDEISRGGDVMLATLDCTGGWFSTQEWGGTRLDRLVSSPGRSIVVHSVTGYWRRFPIEQADRLLLATHMAGEPLSDGNGGPVRIVAPGRRGYWWVKWVERVEVDERPPWWQPPLPMA
jgi:hypothetical protein